MEDSGVCPLCGRTFRSRDLERHANACMDNDSPAVQRRRQVALAKAAVHETLACEERLQRALQSERPRARRRLGTPRFLGQETLTGLCNSGPEQVLRLLQGGEGDGFGWRREVLYGQGQPSRRSGVLMLHLESLVNCTAQALQGVPGARHLPAIVTVFATVHFEGQQLQSLAAKMCTQAGPLPGQAIFNDALAVEVPNFFRLSPITIKVWAKGGEHVVGPNAAALTQHWCELGQVRLVLGDALPLQTRVLASVDAEVAVHHARQGGGGGAESLPPPPPMPLRRRSSSSPRLSYSSSATSDDSVEDTSGSVAATGAGAAAFPTHLPLEDGAASTFAEPCCSARSLQRLRDLWAEPSGVASLASPHLPHHTGGSSSWWGLLAPPGTPPDKAEQGPFPAGARSPPLPSRPVSRPALRLTLTLVSREEVQGSGAGGITGMAAALREAGLWEAGTGRVGLPSRGVSPHFAGRQLRHLARDSAPGVPVVPKSIRRCMAAALARWDPSGGSLDPALRGCLARHLLSPLHRAAAAGHAMGVLHLLKAVGKHWALLRTADGRGLTVLDVAALHGHDNVVTCLVKAADTAGLRRWGRGWTADPLVEDDTDTLESAFSGSSVTGASGSGVVEGLKLCPPPAGSGVHPARAHLIWDSTDHIHSLDSALLPASALTVPPATELASTAARLRAGLSSRSSLAGEPPPLPTAWQAWTGRGGGTGAESGEEGGRAYPPLDAVLWSTWSLEEGTLQAMPPCPVPSGTLARLEGARDGSVPPWLPWYGRHAMHHAIAGGSSRVWRTVCSATLGGDVARRSAVEREQRSQDGGVLALEAGGEVEVGSMSALLDLQDGHGRTSVALAAAFGGDAAPGTQAGPLGHLYGPFPYAMPVSDGGAPCVGGVYACVDRAGLRMPHPAPGLRAVNARVFVGLLRRLLCMGADAGLPDAVGDTPLMHALRTRNTLAALLLLCVGRQSPSAAPGEPAGDMHWVARPTAHNTRGVTATWLACHTSEAPPAFLRATLSSGAQGGADKLPAGAAASSAPALLRGESGASAAPAPSDAAPVRCPPAQRDTSRLLRCSGVLEVVGEVAAALGGGAAPPSPQHTRAAAGLLWQAAGAGLHQLLTDAAGEAAAQRSAADPRGTTGCTPVPATSLPLAMLLALGGAGDVPDTVTGASPAHAAAAAGSVNALRLLAGLPLLPVPLLALAAAGLRDVAAGERRVDRAGSPVQGGTEPTLVDKASTLLRTWSSWLGTLPSPEPETDKASVGADPSAGVEDEEEEEEEDTAAGRDALRRAVARQLSVNWQVPGASRPVAFLGMYWYATLRLTLAGGRLPEVGHPAFHWQLLEAIGSQGVPCPAQPPLPSLSQCAVQAAALLKGDSGLLPALSAHPGAVRALHSAGWACQGPEWLLLAQLATGKAVSPAPAGPGAAPPAATAAEDVHRVPLRMWSLRARPSASHTKLFRRPDWLCLSAPGLAAAARQVGGAPATVLRGHSGLLAQRRNAKAYSGISAPRHVQSNHVVPLLLDCVDSRLGLECAVWCTGLQAARAAEGGALGAVQKAGFQVRADALLHAVDGKGLTPLDCAVQGSHWECAALLQGMALVVARGGGGGELAEEGAPGASWWEESAGEWGILLAPEVYAYEAEEGGGGPEGGEAAAEA